MEGRERGGEPPVDLFDDDIFEDEPKCICLETGSHACGGVDRCWCAPACPVCFSEEVKDDEEALNDYLNLKGRQ